MYTENEVDGTALLELTGSFEDFKELVPKAGDHLKLKKHLRVEFGGTSRMEESHEISAAVSFDSVSYCGTERLSPVSSMQDSGTVCKYIYIAIFQSTHRPYTVKLYT